MISSFQFRHYASLELEWLDGGNRSMGNIRRYLQIVVSINETALISVQLYLANQRFFGNGAKIPGIDRDWAVIPKQKIFVRAQFPNSIHPIAANSRCLETVECATESLNRRNRRC